MKPQIEHQLSAIKEGTITPDQLSAFMDQIPLIEDWCKAIRARVERELLHGNAIPGYKLVEGRKGSRKWSDESEVETAMKGLRLKAGEMYTKKLITAPQAEKLLKNSPDKWEKLSGLITQAEGKPSVAPETDKRKEFVPTPVVDDFEDLT